MGRPIIQGIKPFPMFIFTSFSVIIIGFIFQLVAFLMAALIFRIPLSEMMTPGAMDSRSLISAMKFAQIFGAIGTFIFASMLLSFLYTGSWSGYFNLRPFPRAYTVVLLFAIMAVGLPFVNYLTEINDKMTIPFVRIEELMRILQGQTEDMMMKLIKTDSVGGLVVNLLMIAIIPAVGEELLFRGLIQRHLGESFKNIHIAIIVTATIFSLVHMQIYSFLPRFFLGLVLGYLLYFGKSIWYPVIAHFINNSIGVIFYYLAYQDKAGDTLEEIGTSQSLPITAFISITLLIGLMVMLRRMTKSLTPNHFGKD